MKIGYQISIWNTFTILILMTIRIQCDQQKEKKFQKTYAIAKQIDSLS